jgi:hypothetical protein
MSFSKTAKNTDRQERLHGSLLLFALELLNLLQLAKELASLTGDVVSFVTGDSDDTANTLGDG